MKSIKFLALLAMSAVLPAAADVQALYWQVTSEMSSPITFSAAAFVGVNGNSKTYFTDTQDNAWQEASGNTVATVASILGNTDYSGWSFYIELMNQDTDSNWYVAGQIYSTSGNQYTYSEIQSHIYSSSSMSMSMITPLATGAAHIPEPTSGVLLLMGGALLALRRRRV